jgi:glycosyltransferase involved in cell wall biosynthesis
MRGSIVIPNGVEIPDLPFSRRWLPNGVLRLAFVGRLDPVKGLENLLKALSLLNVEKIALNVYGSGDDAYTAGLRILSRSLGLLQCVTFHGHIDAEGKLKAFTEADVCVVPSHTDNFSMVVAEALAHGVPVIASTGTPWRELEARGCGLWVDNSPQALTDAIRKIRHFDLESMGARGRKWMREQYRWTTMAMKMKAAYQELMRTS